MDPYESNVPRDRTKPDKYPVSSVQALPFDASRKVVEETGLVCLEKSFQYDKEPVNLELLRIELQSSCKLPLFVFL